MAQHNLYYATTTAAHIMSALQSPLASWGVEQKELTTALLELQNFAPTEA